MKLNHKEKEWAENNNAKGRCAGCQILFGHTELDVEKKDYVRSYRKIGFKWCVDCFERRNKGYRIGVGERSDIGGPIEI